MAQSDKGKYEYLERKSERVVQCRSCKNKEPAKSNCLICRGKGYVPKP